MAIKKSDLYSSLWASCDELCGGMDASHFRQKLVPSGYLKAIIGLPANLFYGTGIPACVLVLDKGPNFGVHFKLLTGKTRIT